jgi:hypothetical protein
MSSEPFVNLSEHFTRLAETGVAPVSDWVGVSLTEIRALEQFFGLSFPVIYIQFLAKCGRSAGQLAGWRALYFDDLKEIAEEFSFAQTLMGAATLPEKALIIAEQQNVFDYFLCAGDPNPPVYRLNLATTEAKQPRLLCASFSDYFAQLIDQAATQTGQLKPFFVDECGNLVDDDLVKLAPSVD